MSYAELLTRPLAAKYITARWGFPCSRATLATWATRGGGPMMVRNGRHTLYSRMIIDAWVLSRMSKPMSSTSSRASRLSEEEIALVLPGVDMGDLPEEYITGDPAFDEITRLNLEEDDLEEQLQEAASRYPIK